MPTARTLLLARHGQTEWNVERRMQGRFDSPLTALGRRQAETNGKFLGRQNIGRIYASPLGRVRATLKIMAPHLNAPVQFDDRLTEWDSGEWSSHLYNELSWRWPEEFTRWEANRFHERPPGGENYPDMMARAQNILDAIARDPTPNVAIVSHGMLGRALLGVLLDLPETEVLRIRQRNDIIIRVSYVPRATAEHFVSGKGPRPHVPLEG